MAELPHMPLATDAYLGDTRHLTTLEHGAYLLLLMISWRVRGRPCLPDDDTKLARWAGLDPRTWRRIKPTIMAFWALGSDGFWTQKKQLEMRELTNKRVEKMRNISAARWNRKPLENNEVVDAIGEQPKPLKKTPIVPKGTKPSKTTLRTGYGDPADAVFADFHANVWSKRWPRPSNAPQPAFRAFEKLNTVDREACKAGIAGVAVLFLKTEEKFRPMLSTWINRRGWEADGAAQGATTSNPTEDWSKRLSRFRENGLWAVGWGPKPGEPGCRVPVELLRNAGQAA